MTKQDQEKLKAVKSSWAEYRADAGDDVARNAFIMFPAGTVLEELFFLLGLAKGRRVRAEDRDRLKEVEAHWREYREYNRSDVKANREVRFAAGKLAGDVEFLIGLIEGKPAEAEAEPAVA